MKPPIPSIPSRRPGSHAARLERSARLQRVLVVLRAHPAGITTRELILFTGSCAPHSDVAELRANGYLVACDGVGRTGDGRKVFRYTLKGKAA